MNYQELASMAWNWGLNNKETVALTISLLLTLFQAIRQRLQMKEAIFLLVNTLKDEKKMTPEGQFQLATLEKIDQVAGLAKTSQSAVDEVKGVIDKINVRAGGLKIGSYKGKPIYLEDLSRAGVVLKAGWDVFRGIFRR